MNYFWEGFEKKSFDIERYGKQISAGFGALSGGWLGSGPGFLLRARYEDKFKEKKDRTLKDSLLAYAPLIGAATGAVIGGIGGHNKAKSFINNNRGLVDIISSKISSDLTTMNKLGFLKTEITLKPHQENFVEKLLQNNGSLLAAHATGTGKTLTGIAGFERMKEKGMAKKSLVVVPAALRENFVENLKNFTDSTYSVYGPVGEKQTKGVTDKSNADYNIVSYELFREHGEKLLENTGADTLILDEIHRVRGTEGTTYNKIKELRSKFKNAITLTGSVVNNEPNEVVPLLDITYTPSGHKMVSKGFFDRLFVRKDATTQGIINPKVVVEKNIKNKAQLGEYLKGKVHYIPHDALEKFMPRREVETVKVQMSPEQTKLYNFSMSAVDPITRWKISNNLPVSQKEAKDAFSKLTQARQVSTDPAILDKNLLGKDPYEYSSKVKRVVDDLTKHLSDDPTHKSVIYGNLIHGQIGTVEEALKRKNIPYAKFLGMGQEGMTAKSRPKEIEDFKAGKKRVLLISGAGAEGLDLKNTSMIQMLEGHYNPERIQQAEARVRRMGSFDYLPEKDRKILVKRYVSKPVITTANKLWSQLGMKGTSSGVDEWIYSIAERKDRLNRDFRESFEKSNTKVASRQGGILGQFQAYGSYPGNIIAKIPRRRHEANIQKLLKQRLLDKGEESLISKRHFENILAESKIDERVLDAGMGVGALMSAGVLGGLISPKIENYILKPAEFALQGAAKSGILGGELTSTLNKVKDTVGLKYPAAILTGAALGFVMPSIIEMVKTKTIQHAINGRDEDLNKGIAIYKEKLRKKMERKYRGSKAYVNEYETKKDLGIDSIA